MLAAAQSRIVVMLLGPEVKGAVLATDLGQHGWGTLSRGTANLLGLGNKDAPSRLNWVGVVVSLYL